MIYASCHVWDSQSTASFASSFGESGVCKLMSIPQQLGTIGVIVLGTMLTRFLPFFIFPDNRPTPPFVRYLGCVLPAAVFGMQVVYCLKDIRLFTGSHGLPELIAVFVVIALHLWKRQMLLSIAGGTFVYMFLVQLVFPGL